MIAIRAGRLFDATGETYAKDQVIVIRGQDIAAVGPGVEIPANAEVIDLSDATVLPGMIGTHVHMMGFSTPANQWIAGVQSSEMALHAGFTTVVGRGSREDLPWATIELRNAIMEGRLLGPRMQVTGPVVNPRGGIPAELSLDYDELELPVDRLAIRGTDAARPLKIMGTDWVKVYSTWDNVAPREDMFEHYPGDPRYLPETDAMPGLPALTNEEFRATADEGRRLGLITTCHT